VLVLSAGAAQVTTSKGPTFEVASVRVNKSGPAGTRIDFGPDRVTLVNVPLRAIIQLAYGIQQPTRRLGLKLNSEKETLEVLVVDHIDRPTEN
jgi:hypothetical protein